MIKKVKIQKSEKINIYIDGANLDKGIKDLGWNLDYKRFYRWLKDKYKFKNIYLFIGLVPRFKDLYKYLQEIGYVLVFKETTSDGDGNVKGNCDADLVLAVSRDFYEDKFDKSIIVSSDGDYASMIKFLKDKKAIKILLSPNNKCSILLKRTGVPISYLNYQKRKIQQNRKNP